MLPFRIASFLPDGWMIAGVAYVAKKVTLWSSSKIPEESPDSGKRWRVTPAKRELRESATETIPPTSVGKGEKVR
jgi:hypothetical protein